MDAKLLFRRTAAGFNKAMIPLLGTGPGRRLLGGAFAVVTYTGRRSGREFTMPVNYRRKGEDIVIVVAAPSAKNWWRNFLGAGAPMHLRLGEQEVDGHAVAVQDAKGGVRVTVTPTA